MRIDLRHATMLKTSMCNLLTNKQKRTYNTCNQTKSEALAVALGAWTALVKH